MGKTIFNNMNEVKFEVYDRRSFLALVKSSCEKKPEKFRPERHSNPDLCNAVAVLFHFSLLSGQLEAGRHVGR